MFLYQRYTTISLVFSAILFISWGGNSNTALKNAAATSDAAEKMTPGKIAAIDEKADSTKNAEEKKRQKTIVTELDGAKLKKTESYPYISIKFYQQDTDVEMVLDPLSTNLDLDLKRRPDGTLEVRKGDEILTQMGPQDSTKAGPYKAPPFDPSEDLTDDIIRDINLAQQLFYQNEYDDALKILNSSLEKKKTASAYALGGSIYFVNGEMNEAVRAWENALKINPDLDELKGLVARYKK